MLSILVLYSTDRLRQFATSLSLWRQLEKFDHCQVVLVSDGPTSLRPPGVDVVEVQRPGPYYCWGKVWDAGLEACQYDRIVYVDCDRVLSTEFLRTVDRLLRDDLILYPAKLLNVKFDFNLQRLQRLRDLPDRYPTLWTPEAISANPADAPCRGPFSGCTALTRSTYERIGPVDRRYVGWGYPDVDYLTAALRAGVKFQSIPATHLHLKHGYAVPHSQFMMMNCWNGLQYHAKWGTEPTQRLLQLVAECGVTAKDLITASLDEAIGMIR